MLYVLKFFCENSWFYFLHFHVILCLLIRKILMSPSYTTDTFGCKTSDLDTASKIIKEGFQQGRNLKTIQSSSSQLGVILLTRGCVAVFRDVEWVSSGWRSEMLLTSYNAQYCPNNKKLSDPQCHLRNCSSATFQVQSEMAYPVSPAFCVWQGTQDSQCRSQDSLITLGFCFEDIF